MLAMEKGFFDGFIVGGIESSLALGERFVVEVRPG